MAEKDQSSDPPITGGADADPDGTRLEQARRKARLTVELRANLRRRKSGHATGRATGKDE
jgi:hypothetical protein